jgi:hypothetical protein
MLSKIRTKCEDAISLGLIKEYRISGGSDWPVVHWVLPDGSEGEIHSGVYGALPSPGFTGLLNNLQRFTETVGDWRDRRDWSKREKYLEYKEAKNDNSRGNISDSCAL